VALPQTPLGANSAPQTTHLDLRGPTSKGKWGKGREMKGRGWGNGRRRKEGGSPPLQFYYDHCSQPSKNG